MIYHSDWLYHNLDDRLNDKLIPFKFGISLHKFKKMNFHEAADYTANEITKKYNNIYLSFSGGADSEYVLRTFARNNIKIIPIIILIDNLDNIEIQNAFNVCEELHITPKIINISESNFFKDFYERSYKKSKIVGIRAYPKIIAADIVNNGVLLSGDYLIDDHTPDIQAYDWDFMTDILTDTKCINFYCHNIEIFYSMISFDDRGFNYYKYNMYGLKEREKSKFEFSNSFDEFLHKLIERKNSLPNRSFTLCSKSSILKLLNNL